ncbi:MAG: hypothetical protein KDC90_04625 [Ignavibacteriae bacterium]|nr:hypothetical protein [Ignavibacteriota bacterium]
MKKSIPVLLSSLILIVGCTHYSSISPSEVFADKYKYVTKVDYKNKNSIFIENEDSNKIILPDSILVVSADSSTTKISLKDVQKFNERKFSFPRTLWLIGGIGLVAILLFIDSFDPGG